MGDINPRGVSEMTKKVAIVQSNYIPWKGYFDMIAAVDEFILYDDMQYTRRDWRNRNQIKTPTGLLWLTVPVKVKGKYNQTIKETEVDGNSWLMQHQKSIIQNYKKAPYFNDVWSYIEPLYNKQYTFLSELNRIFIEVICNYLGINTLISNSWNYNLTDCKTEQLADLTMQADGVVYISGPAAKDYIVESVFDNLNIKLEWFNYSGYPEYKQLYGDFIHNVTILDLLFNCGKKSANYMSYVNK